MYPYSNWTFASTWTEILATKFCNLSIKKTFNDQILMHMLTKNGLFYWSDQVNVLIEPTFLSIVTICLLRQCPHTQTITHYSRTVTSTVCYTNRNTLLWGLPVDMSNLCGESLHIKQNSISARVAERRFRNSKFEFEWLSSICNMCVNAYTHTVRSGIWRRIQFLTATRIEQRFLIALNCVVYWTVPLQCTIH